MAGFWAQTTAIVGVHHPGHTLLHRIPAGFKVTGLLVAVAVVLLIDSPWIAAALAGGSVLVLVSTGVPAATLTRPLRAVLVMLLALTAAQVWLLDWPQAVTGSSRVLACLALAWAVSLTTPLTEILELITRVLRPLRRVRVDPEQVALTIALAIRSVALIVTAVAQADEARHARGSRMSIRALVVPSVVRTVKIAEALGEGLLARGYGADREP
ncbi:MAG TPA: energy-coupling factor transporter transmembrane protein EcfT [Beutenbergiaceae bacterium]|nr:energy-coupling factor transporter transmembrane protein EcfT [Beutenbergiaceae bacterium]